MLKETQTEDTIDFFVTFLSLGAFQLGGGPPAPLWLRLFSANLFHMRALLKSDYAILTYILYLFALCRGPKEGGMTQCSHPKYAPRCACLNGHSILVTA